MGNCQAAETATVVIVHPGYKIERIYWSISARDVMNRNVGYYVAQVVKSPFVVKTDNGLPVKQLKLLRPDDTLLIGQVYRLISYQDVLKEFAAKKCMKLGKLLMERGVIELKKKDVTEAQSHHVPNNSSTKNYSGGNRRRNGGRQHHQSHGGGPWKPALKSISEIGN
ncbi:amino-acid acetyltransferase-like protein [Tanacetum coccineum]|uniref:Amino-acid acetyltransferase-like protein n=1 Tax=Tanacetum coccineum TaxID=301880 RepID=A0ABQ5ESM0_9ASTR